MEAKKFFPITPTMGIKTLQKWTKANKSYKHGTKKQKVRLSSAKIRNFLEKNDFKTFEQDIRHHVLSTENVILIFSYTIPDTLAAKVIKITPELPAATQLSILKMPNRELLKSYAWRYHLSDNVIKELILHGEDDFLMDYIRRRKLSEEMQCYLILAHKIKLIEQYISAHGLGKKAQQEFLNFMKEYLHR